MKSPTGNRGLTGRVFDVALLHNIAIDHARNRWTGQTELPKMVSTPNRMDDSAPIRRRGRDLGVDPWSICRLSWEGWRSKTP